MAEMRSNDHLTYRREIHAIATQCAGMLASPNHNMVSPDLSTGGYWINGTFGPVDLADEHLPREMFSIKLVRYVKELGDRGTIWVANRGPGRRPIHAATKLHVTTNYSDVLVYPLFGFTIGFAFGVADVDC